MPVLKNPKHERFAQLVSSGVSKTQAAKDVGYSELRAPQQGSNLAKTRKVAERIQELTVRVEDQTASTASISRAWVLERLIENVDRCMQAIQVMDKLGKPTGIYAWNPKEANAGLALIGKEIGMFVEKKDLTVRSASIEEIPQDELIEVAKEAGLYISAEMDSGPRSIQ